MALQILNYPTRASSIGSAAGEAVGGSIATGLQSLLQHKMNGLSQQKRAEGLSALGLPASYANLDPKILEQVVHQRLQQPSQEAFAQGLQSILGGSQQQNQPKILPTQQASEGEILGQKIFGNNQPSIQQRIDQLPPQIQQQIKRQQLSQLPAGLNPQQAIQLAQLGLQKQNLERKEDIAQKMFEKKESTKVQALANKETLPYFNEVSKEEKSAKKIDLLTGRMVNLIEKGKLPDPVFYKQVKSLEENLTPFKSISTAAGGGATIGAAGGAVFGGPLGAAVGGALGSALGGLAGYIASLQGPKQRGELLEKYPDTEEFEKLSSEFISGAKAIFGSRVTDNDLKAFMQTVPQLINTEHGKKSIIRNIQTLNDATHARYKAMKEIIKENGGNRPADLSVQVEERVNKKLDELANKFIKGL